MYPKINIFNMILGLNEPLIVYLLATKNALKDPLPPL